MKTEHTPGPCLEALKAAGRCLDSIERNQICIVQNAKFADPIFAQKLNDTIEGWKRNLNHARAIIAKTEKGQP